MPIQLPTKVTAEITAKGWTVKVYAGDTVLSERPWQIERPIVASSTKPGDVFDDLPDFPVLADTVDGLNVFDVARELILLEQGNSADQIDADFGGTDDEDED